MKMLQKLDRWAESFESERAEAIMTLICQVAFVGVILFALLHADKIARIWQGLPG